MSNAAAFSGGYVANLGPSEEGFLMPAVDNEGGFFWEGALAGELRIQACESCGRLRHPPRPMCPWCRSTARVNRSWFSALSKWTFTPGRARLIMYVRAATGSRARSACASASCALAVQNGSRCSESRSRACRA